MDTSFLSLAAAVKAASTTNLFILPPLQTGLI